MPYSDKLEIESFLKEFKIKLKTFDIIFKNREKNGQALYDLEITHAQRLKYIEKLKTEDYYRGPSED
jgi:hypothetical protein